MTDFEVMKVMCDQNLDIRMCPDITDAQKVKAGGKVTFGVPADTFDLITKQMMSGVQTHYIAMYIVNKEQFERIKSEAKS